MCRREGLKTRIKLLYLHFPTIFIVISQTIYARNDIFTFEFKSRYNYIHSTIDHYKNTTNKYNYCVKYNTN